MLLVRVGSAGEKEHIMFTALTNVGAEVGVAVKL
jgi:hypothetical protein